MQTKTSRTETQVSITCAIADYEKELQVKRHDLLAALRRATSGMTAKPLRERLDEVNTEIKKLHGGESSLVSEPDEFEQMENDLDFWYGKLIR